MLCGDGEHFTALLFPTQVIGGYQTRQQQDGGKLHRQHIGAKELDTHLLGGHLGHSDQAPGHPENAVGQKAQQDQREQGWAPQVMGVSHFFSCAWALPRFSIITTNTNSTMMAPA